MTNNNTKKELPKKEFWSIFWRRGLSMVHSIVNVWKLLDFLRCNNTFFTTNLEK